MLDREFASEEINFIIMYYVCKKGGKFRTSELLSILHPYPNTFLEGRRAADSDSDQAGRGRRRRMATVARKKMANTPRPNYHPLGTRTGARAGTHPP